MLALVDRWLVQHHLYAAQRLLTSGQRHLQPLIATGTDVNALDDRTRTRAIGRPLLATRLAVRHLAIASRASVGHGINPQTRLYTGAALEQAHTAWQELHSAMPGRQPLPDGSVFEPMKTAAHLTVAHDLSRDDLRVTPLFHFAPQHLSPAAEMRE